MMYYTTKRHVGHLNVYRYVKETNLKRLDIVKITTMYHSGKCKAMETVKNSGCQELLEYMGEG